MDKQKKIKCDKRGSMVRVNWIRKKPTGQLIHNCVKEVFKKMQQSHKKKIPKEVFDKTYAKMIDKHVNIIEKNIGIDYINVKLNLVKDLTTKKK